MRQGRWRNRGRGPPWRTGRRRARGSRARLRNFGLTLAAGFAVLGGLLSWRGRDIDTYFYAAAAVFLVVGLVAPSVLGPVRRVWLKVGEGLGWVMTRVIMRGALLRRCHAR